MVDKNKSVPVGWKTNSPFMQILSNKYDVYGRFSLYTKVTNTNVVCYSNNELMVEKKSQYWRVLKQQ